MTDVGLALIAAGVVLAVHNVGVERLPAAFYVPACLTTTAVVVGLARSAGIGLDDLGATGAGVGPGVAVGAAMVVALLLAGLVPAIRPVFADRRMAGVTRIGTAYRALVRIPLGTVILEEVAFRGVLPELLGRLVSFVWAVAGAAALFGLWHVVPMAATLRTNGRPVRPAPLAAAVVATGLAGIGFSGLRWWTGGLLGPAIVHASASITATLVAARRMNSPNTDGFVTTFEDSPT